MTNEEDFTDFMREIVDAFIDCMFATKLELPVDFDYSDLKYIVLNNMNYSKLRSMTILISKKDESDYKNVTYEDLEKNGGTNWDEVLSFLEDKGACLIKSSQAINFIR